MAEARKKRIARRGLIVLRLRWRTTMRIVRQRVARWIRGAEAAFEKNLRPLPGRLRMRARPVGARLMRAWRRGRSAFVARRHAVAARSRGAYERHVRPIGWRTRRFVRRHQVRTAIAIDAAVADVAAWRWLVAMRARRRAQRVRIRTALAARRAGQVTARGARNVYAATAAYGRSLTRRATADTGSGYPIFFLLAAICAAIQIPVWVLLAGKKGPLPAESAPLLWHMHESLFGFISAFLVGFLLAAVNNMTGRPPLRGLALRVTILIWLAGRAAWWIPGFTAKGAIEIDLIFIPAVLCFAWRELVHANRPRMHLIVGTLIFYWLGKVVALTEIYLGLPGVVNPGLNMSMDAVIFMTAVVAGSVAPLVTERALGRNVADESQLLDAPPLLDAVALSALGLFIVFDITMPLAEPTGWLALLAGALNLARMAYWQGYRALDKPVVWIVHLAYLWLCLGLFASAGAYLGGWYSASVGRHVLTIGAVATGCLAVMTRETLDHAERIPNAGMLGVIAYLLISAAVLIRVASGLTPEGLLTFWLLIASGGAWTLAFVAYLAGYGRNLILRATHRSENSRLVREPVLMTRDAAPRSEISA